MLGRRPEMLDAATKAREIHVGKHDVRLISRLERFLEQ